MNLAPSTVSKTVNASRLENRLALCCPLRHTTVNKARLCIVYLCDLLAILCHANADLLTKALGFGSIGGAYKLPRRWSCNQSTHKLRSVIRW